MNQQKATETFGPIVFENAKKVVRVREKPDGNITVFSHSKVNGVERIPGGYLCGYNIMEDLE